MTQWTLTLWRLVLSLVLLQGRLELPWSRYGIFQGDAHIFRVTPFPMGHPQTETEQWDQTIEVTGRESEVNPV